MRRLDFASDQKQKENMELNRYPVHNILMGQMWNSIRKMDFGFSRMARFSIVIGDRNPITALRYCQMFNWKDQAMFLNGVTDQTLELSEEEIRRNFLLYRDVESEMPDTMIDANGYPMNDFTDPRRRHQQFLETNSDATFGIVKIEEPPEAK